ncbi:MAG: hypothetical protein IPI19_16060 [Ignavibacteriales bacterium]|nr:hypothetical protein [Ignavibacteriales bacterium]
MKTKKIVKSLTLTENVLWKKTTSNERICAQIAKERFDAGFDLHEVTQHLMLLKKKSGIVLQKIF